jgi:AP-4 complex subunit epsilon-1
VKVYNSMQTNLIDHKSNLTNSVIMEITSKLAGLAKRHTNTLVNGELESLIRAIGEAKSKHEEDQIVTRMISMSKQQIKEGLPRKGDNTKALKDLLVYLIYIDMLGHDTSWAAAAVIQLCSHKSLIVKKVS